MAMGICGDHPPPSHNLVTCRLSQRSTPDQGVKLLQCPGLGELAHRPQSSALTELSTQGYNSAIFRMIESSEVPVAGELTK